MGNLKSVVSKANAIIETINPCYDMSCKNMREIRDTYGGSFNAICCSFQFGYLQGMKAAKAEMEKGGAVNVNKSR